MGGREFLEINNVYTAKDVYEAFKEMREDMPTPSEKLTKLDNTLDIKIKELRKLQRRGEEILETIKKREDLTSRKSSFKQQLLNSLGDISDETDAAKRALDEQQLHAVKERIRVLLLESYDLIMKLREALSGETIEYSIGNSTKHRSFVVDESTLYDNTSLSISLVRTNKVITDFNISLRISSTRIINSRTQENPKDKIGDVEGSTLWSKGLRILEKIREFYFANQTEAKGLGINAGHFYEAYLAFNGNLINTIKDKHPDNLTYAVYMIGLANNRAFDTGGDVGNLQAKINSASLINLKTLLNELDKIKKIITNSKGAIENLKTHFRIIQEQVVDLTLKEEKEEAIRKLLGKFDTLVENIKSVK